MNIDQIRAFKAAAGEVAVRAEDISGGLCRAINLLMPCGGAYEIMPLLIGHIRYGKGMEKGQWTMQRVLLLLLICELSAEELLEMANSPVGEDA